MLIRFLIIIFVTNFTILCSYSQLPVGRQSISISEVVASYNTNKINADSAIDIIAKNSSDFFSYRFQNSDSFILKDELFPSIANYFNQNLVPYKKVIDFQINDTDLSDRFKVIYSKIEVLEKIDRNARTTAALEEVFDLVTHLKESKAKVFLLLSYYKLTIPLIIDLTKLNQIFSNVYSQALNITDLEEKASAFEYLGDEFAEFQAPTLAISAYSVSHTFYYSLVIDSLSKFYYQGRICEKIARLFSYSETDLVNSFQKQADYLLAAYEYYVRAEKRDEANYLRFELLICLNNINKSENANDIKNYILNCVIGLRESSDNLFYYLCGSLLMKEKKLEAAKSFFLRSLVGLINKMAIKPDKKSDYLHLLNCIHAITKVYSLLGDKELAYSYALLEKSILLKNKDDEIFRRANINLAEFFLSSRMIDSAHIYLNAVLNNYKCGGRELFGLNDRVKTLKLMSEVYTSKNRDSAKYFYNCYSLSKDFLIEHYSILLYMASSSELSNLLSLKEFEVATEKYNYTILNSFTKKIVYQSNLYTTLLIIVGIILIGLVYLYKRSKKKARQKQENLELQIAYKNITSHDIFRLINRLPTLVNNFDKKFLDGSNRNLLVQIKNITQYISKIHKSGRTETSSIKQQYEISKLYADVFKQTSLPNDCSVSVYNEITDEYVLNHLPTPSLLINNFIKNSLEHGFADKSIKKLEIRISAVSSPDSHVIYINDNGCGINYAKRNGGTQGEGIKLAKNIVRAFNKRKNQYHILFDSDSIWDKSEKGEGRGTNVKIEFKKSKLWR